MGEVAKDLHNSSNQPENGASSGGSSNLNSAAEEVSNKAKNAKKVSPDDIGDFLKAGKDWHKGSAKKDFLKQF
jgi:hypothetical protein